MFVPKILLLTALFLPSVVLAVPTQSCKASFHHFIVDREPGGYPVNKATLAVLSAGICTRKNDADPERDYGTKIILRNTTVDVYDNVTRKHQTAKSTTSVDIDIKRKLARIFNNYLGLSIELPFRLQGDQIIIRLAKPPVQIFGPAAAPYYTLRIGSELTIDVANVSTSRTERFCSESRRQHQCCCPSVQYDAANYWLQIHPASPDDFIT